MEISDQASERDTCMRGTCCTSLRSARAYVEGVRKQLRGSVTIDGMTREDIDAVLVQIEDGLEAVVYEIERA